MQAYLSGVTLILLLSSPLNAAALMLDCEDNGDGTLTCIRIENSVEASLDRPAKTPAENMNQEYIEAARKECTYRKPHRRTGKAGSNRSLALEADKAAREEYDRCVLKAARALKKAAQ